jgi:hypothetical protein
MSTGARALWITVGVVAVLAIGFTAAAAVATSDLMSAQWIDVRVVEHGAGGQSIRIAVPTVVAGAAITVAPHVMPAEARREVTDQIGEWGPMLRELAAELERMPDAVLVQVEEDGETVEVAKRGARLVVKVRSADADVDVAMPVALVGGTLRAFAI